MRVGVQFFTKIYIIKVSLCSLVIEVDGYWWCSVCQVK